MPKVKKIESETNKYAYEYECDCGTKVTLHQEEIPKKLVRCFQCQKELKIKE